MGEQGVFLTLDEGSRLALDSAVLALAHSVGIGKSCQIYPHLKHASNPMKIGLAP
jgi:hypothetical protein